MLIANRICVDDSIKFLRGGFSIALHKLVFYSDPACLVISTKFQIWHLNRRCYTQGRIMSEHLIETFENGVCTLTMNRPEARNAMSGPMMVALNEAVPRVAADKNVRAVVLTGAGGAFCAGGDVKGFAS